LNCNYLPQKQFLNRMKRFKIGLIIVAVIIIIAELLIIDYNDLFGSKNIGNYLVMLSMALLIISQILPIKNDRIKIEKKINTD